MPRSRYITRESTREKLVELGVKRSEFYDRAACIATLSAGGDHGAIWLFLPDGVELMVGGYKVPDDVAMLEQTRLTNSSKMSVMVLDPVVHSDHPMVNGEAGKCRSVLAIPLVNKSELFGQITIGFERPADTVSQESLDLGAEWAEIVVQILVDQSNVRSMLNDLTAAYSV